MVHEFAMNAQQHWRKLRAFRELVDAATGADFIDGIYAREIQIGRLAPLSIYLLVLTK